VNGPAYMYDPELRREALALRVDAQALPRTHIVGDSAAMRQLGQLVARVARTRATVLVTGETGTGKELVARAIHEQSDRARRPFVPINCSALPESLLESELFGHTRGSFTGAVATKRGLFEEAAGGTLFLDEISTIPPSAQVKLLRVLQDRRLYRVGGTQPLSVDFRLVAATNVDLAAEVRAGRFREDLYYRLNVFPVRVPPLRERRSDIPLLVHWFRIRCAQDNDLVAPEIDAAVMNRLVEYEWPGNVRELENFIERTVIMCAGQPVVECDLARPDESPAESRLLETARREGWDLERLERCYILDVLESTRGHRGRAAEILGIDRRTLYRKLKEYARAGVVLPDAPEVDGRTGS
jgi:DNA-binding NtrC family response regulator